jgi:hypothetical protein
VEAGTCTKAARRRATNNLHRTVAIASWVRGRRTHLSNYGGCSHAKEELLRKKGQKSPTMHPPGRMFCSSLTRASISFAAADHDRVE